MTLLGMMAAAADDDDDDDDDDADAKNIQVELTLLMAQSKPVSSVTHHYIILVSRVTIRMICVTCHYKNNIVLYNLCHVSHLE